MNTKNAKKAKRVGRGGGPEGPSGHWSQWIDPKGAALLSETLGRAHFVCRIRGPNGVTLVAAHGDLMDLPAGAVRATSSRDGPGGEQERRIGAH